MSFYAGLDIGGTKCAVVLGQKTGGEIEVLDRQAFATRDYSGPEGALEKCFALLDGQLERHGVSREALQGIGVSCGGPLDSVRGLILSPPNLIGWDNVPVVKMLEKRFGRPAFLQNDANACALAEWRYGAGRGTKNMIFITFGTGCGSGLILDGRLYAGATDMAGECGHMRIASFGPVGYGKAGSMEGFCSGSGIAQLGQTLALEQLQQGKQTGYCASAEELSSVTALSVAQAAHAGDETALEVYRLAGSRLGLGLSLMIDLLNPQAIVIGSIFVRCRDLLLETMNQALERECLPHSLKACAVLPAQLGERLGDIAALTVAEGPGQA